MPISKTQMRSQGMFDTGALIALDRCLDNADGGVFSINGRPAVHAWTFGEALKVLELVTLQGKSANLNELRQQVLGADWLDGYDPMAKSPLYVHPGELALFAKDHVPVPGDLMIEFCQFLKLGGDSR